MLTGWGLDPALSWHFGYAAAAVGMFFGLLWYVTDQRTLAEVGRHPAPVDGPEGAAAIRRTLWLGVGGSVALVLLIMGARSLGLIALDTPAQVASAFGVGLIILVASFFGWLFFGSEWTAEERKQLRTIFVLFIGATVFWSVFEQSGSTLSLFAERSTRNEAFGFNFPAAWWQSANALFIVIFAGFFAWLWASLGSRNPSSTAKFSIGLILVGASFFWMVPAAQLANGGNRVGWWWLAGCYLLQTLGELCLSPVGLSAMTRLAPAKVASMMMGVWFMATSVGTFIGGLVASQYENFSLPTIFGAVGGSAVLAGLIMALLVKPIQRMMTSES